MPRTKTMPNGDENEAMQEQEQLAEVPMWDQFIINIEMGSRPSTNPIKRDGLEGYPTAINVGKHLRTTRVSKEKIDFDLQHVDWRNVGNPNDFKWWFPAGAVKKGDTLRCDAVHENVYSNGVPTQQYNLKIEIPNTEK